MRKNFSDRSQRRALTLVEVLTSVALLSTVLVGMLIAHAKHTRQLRRADSLQTAIRLSDDLLAAWYQDGGALTPALEGRFEGNAEFFWRLQRQPAGAEQLWGAQVLRLATYDVAAPTKPVLVVDILESLPQTIEPRPELEP